MSVWEAHLQRVVDLSYLYYLHMTSSRCTSSLQGTCSNSSAIRAACEKQTSRQGWLETLTNLAVTPGQHLLALTSCLASCLASWLTLASCSTSCLTSCQAYAATCWLQFPCKSVGATLSILRPHCYLMTQPDADLLCMLIQMAPVLLGTT